jgi:phospholipase C
MASGPDGSPELAEPNAVCCEGVHTTLGSAEDRIRTYGPVNVRKFIVRKGLSMSIEHIVIIVKENHAFDNYFGAFPNANGARLGQAQNPPPSDPPHDHLTWMHRASDSRFHLQYTENDISGYFNYARKYTLCDNYFTEVAGPSTPNHLMLICADAPIINNPAHLYNPRPSDTYHLSSLPLQLERAQLTWGNYGGYAFHYIRELAAHQGNHTRDLFLQHASSGQLPSVSWV